MNYSDFKKLNLSLDMSRGKPCPEQLSLSMPLLKEEDVVIDDIDTRNYSHLDGLPSMKKLFAELAGVKENNVIIFGNSSLEIMYTLISDAFIKGVNGSAPLCKLNKVKWLCVVPGYDRHFAICEHFGFEMILVPMKEDGPDMNMVEEYVKDPTVKGIWCVPLYSNPTGNSYSDEVVRRLANLKPAAKDFRIYWDNAYIVHHLYKDRRDSILNIIDECKKAGNSDLVYEFVSTSKITFAGAGVAALITSDNNKKAVLDNLKIKTIGYDKINELRHVKFLKDIKDIDSLMDKHADIIRPKFEAVEKIFEEELTGIAKWTNPRGGYFITLYVDNKAKEVIKLCKEAGVILTDARAAFPYHKDPTNSVIRIAPTYLSLEDVEMASRVIASAIKHLK